MAAANARVLAFGASAGIMAGVSKALAGIVTTTIKVEKSLANINSVLNVSSAELQKFGGKLFDVAKNTGQTFDQVAEAATELARQGLGATETLKRLNDSLILSRLSGLDAAQSVEGLTAAYNSFASSGITTSEILNKLVVVSQKFAVSEKDLIEGLKRSASVANQAGVSLDELIAIITAVQEKTARGGAVIGNSFKTIFARLQDRAVLADLDALGIAIQDTATQKALPATTILQNLATSFGSLSQLKQADIAKKLGGVYQLSNLLAAVQDLGSETSKYSDAVELSQRAADEAYRKNAALNNTLEALINKVTISAEQLGNTLGEIGVTDNLKNIISFFNGILEGVQNILAEESALGGLFRGLAKGVGAVLSGPGLALFGAVILKLSKDLVQFGFASLKSFFGIGKAAKEVQSVEMSIQQILTRNVDLQQKLFALEGDRAGQLQVITRALVDQEALLRKTASTASSLAPAVASVGGKATPSGLRINPPTAAGGYIPAVAKESSDISRGVGGARGGDKPVVIPNFNFGGGKRGSMVAHTGEYIVPNFQGKGSAVFNRDMVRSMGLPSGAQKINAAGGFIPNFAKQSLLPKEVVDSFDPQDLDWYKKVGSKKDIDIDKILLSEGKIRGSGKLAYSPRQIEITKMVQNARKKAAENVPMLSFDTSQFDLPGGRGLGLIGISGKESTSALAQKRLKNAQIQILKNKGITTKDEDLAIQFTNIKTNSLGNIKNLNVEQVQKDFQQKVNSLFGEPLRMLANDIFGSLGGLGSSGDLRDRYLFGNDALGNIFESAINLYTKKAEDLESFDEGEAMRNKAFDFNMTNKYQADKINGLFFSQIGGVGKADAKRKITSEELRSVIDKSINDPEVREEMKKQAMTKTASNGFIPNFADKISEKTGSDVSLQNGILKVGYLNARRGNPLFEILRLLDQRKIKGIDAGAVIGPKIPDIIVGMKKIMERKRLKDPSIPRIPIQGFFSPARLASKISERSEYKFKNRPEGISQYDKKGIDYYNTKDQQNFISALREMGVDRKSDSFARLEQIYPNGLAGGYIPNFANPLQNAIGREMAAGVPSSQIYVDKNPRLKSASNPMGLMVANRRDEPAGGFQGINRAMKEGRNPQTYGAAGGFIPNFAPFDITGTALSGPKGQVVSFAKINKAINDFVQTLDLAKIDLSIASEAKALKDQIRKLTEVSKLEKSSKEAVAKAGLDYVKAEKAATSANTALTQATQNKEKTTSDYVGKLFLLQSVTSGLTSVFGEMGFIGEKIAATATSVTGAFLSFQEIGRMAKAQALEGPSESQVLLNDFATARRSGNATGASNAARQIAQNNRIFTPSGAAARLANQSGGLLGRFAGVGGGALGVISKVGPLFSKFVPVLGQAVTIFQGVNAVAKAFGFDLTGTIMKGLKSFGQALGLVATDAEKTAESFRKSRQKAGEKILAGEFNKGFEISGALNEKLTEARKEEIKKRIGDDAAKDATNEELLKKDFNRSLEVASFGINQKFLAEQAGLTPEQLQEQYAAGKGLQSRQFVGNKIKYMGSATGPVPVGTEAVYQNVGLSKPQAELLNLFETDLAGSYSSEESRKAFAKAKEQNLQGDQLQPFINDLFQSAYKNLEESGKSDQVRQFKIELAGAGDATDPEVIQKLIKSFNELTKGFDKSAAVAKAVETANLSVLQKRLDNSLAYQQSLFEVATSEEISLGIRKDMLGLSKLETMEAESKLENIKLEKQATLEQARASMDLFKSSEVLNAKLNEVSVGEVSKESFEKIAEISEEVNKLILEQGGYTAEVEAKTKQLLERKLNDKKASESILAILKATNVPYQKNLEIQKLNTSSAKAQQASLEAINFLEEKRKQSASSYYDSQSRSFDLSKRSIDIELEKFKIEKEREKIGKNAAQVLAIDKEIVEKETATINAKLKFDKQAIINDLRKQFSDAALELGLNLEGDIKGASSLEQFQKISEDIANKERQVQIDKIKASITELSAYKVRSDYFKNAVTEAADYLSEKIKPKDANFFSRLGDKFLGLVNPPVTQRRDDVKALEDTLARLSKSPKAKSPLLTEVENALKETELQAQEAANQIGNLNNSLDAAGANLTTFSNLVANVFRDLSDQITQNAFGLLTATDASSISSSLVESEKFGILSAGPPTADTIKNAENRKALLLQELEVKKAITAEDRVAKQFELNQLEEILALKEEALAAETSEERLKILDKIIAKERERAPLGARLSAIISPTQEEKIMRLEDTLVSASKAFRDNMVDALTNAIDQGGDLGDILRSAAYDYVKAINRENIGNLFDSALNVGKMGMTSLFASGGRVTGGSGSKDDVPAMLMGGEYVINKRAVQKYGPQFFDSINSGQMNGFATGGQVQKGPQGNFYTPGTYGTGAIEGKRNLLDFATQTGTSGQFDRIINMEGYQSIALEPESSRLTVAGMRNSPAFEATQSAKQQAFDLYLQQYRQEQEAKKAEDEQKKAFRNQLIMLAATAAIGGVGKAAMIGGKNAVATLGKDAGFLQKAGAFAKGSIFGGDIGSGIMGGGLKNLFSGNFGLAYQSEILKALPIGAGSQNAIGKSLFSSGMSASKKIPSSYNQKDMIGGNIDLGPPPISNSGAIKAQYEKYYKKPDDKFSYRRRGYGGDAPSLLPPKGFAVGGMIPSTSGIDTVPAMLSGGEFIMNRSAVQNIGVGNLQSMNSGTQSVLTDEASKEMNEKLLSKLDELIEASSGGGDITINVSGSGNETATGANNQDASSMKQQLAREVKDAVLKVLDEQKRLGGRLRR
jgi:TP901 family phage tail tape measure protein